MESTNLLATLTIPRPKLQRMKLKDKSYQKFATSGGSGRE
jgi:hypothetical protein